GHVPPVFIRRPIGIARKLRVVHANQIHFHRRRASERVIQTDNHIPLRHLRPASASLRERRHHQCQSNYPHPSISISHLHLLLLNYSVHVFTSSRFHFHLPVIGPVGPSVRPVAKFRITE